MSSTRPTPLSVNGSGQPRQIKREEKIPTPRFRHIERYTRDQGCSQRPIRELGQVFQSTVPEDRFQHDAGILNQPMLEITTLTPAAAGPS